MRNKSSILSYVISTILFFIGFYKFLPVLNLYYWTLPFLVLIYGIVILFIDYQIHKFVNKIGAAIFGIGIIFITIIPFFTSSAIFHSEAYRSIIGPLQESEFIQDISPIEVDEVRLVDEDMASRLGDKKLGEEPALGSQAQLGRFNIQKVNGKLYWISPLMHRNIWKWLDNPQGTRGYVMVSASNPQDVKLVMSIEGKPFYIKYQPKAFFNDYLKRHIYFKGYMNVGLTDFSFEINEEGKPFWVVTVFQKEVGYGGSNAIGVLVVDAQTGKIEEYDINNAPQWVDRIQPENFIKNQLDYWGLYVKGWLNSFLAEEGVLLTTPGMSLVYGKDNNSYWYTGITSSGADESTIGFTLVNTRTKEAKLYRQSGATEEAAMSSAEGKVQEKNYQATFPVMYNILGTPTYVCSLKDKAGLVKLVAMISVEDYSILGIGETKLDALRAYRNALRNTGNQLSLDETMKEIVGEGRVLRFNTDIQNGNSYYYFIIEGYETKIFAASSQISQEVPLTKEGDLISIKYADEERTVVDITAFDNKTMNIQ